MKVQANECATQVYNIRRDSVLNCLFQIFQLLQICGLLLIKFEIHQYMQGKMEVSVSAGYVSKTSTYTVFFINFTFIVQRCYHLHKSLRRDPPQIPTSWRLASLYETPWWLLAGERKQRLSDRGCGEKRLLLLRIHCKPERSQGDIFRQSENIETMHN